MVLQRLHDFKLYYKLNKCVFSTNTINFLRFIISLQGVSMKCSQINIILDWPVLYSVYNVLIFVWFANFYRRFIKGYS